MGTKHVIACALHETERNAAERRAGARIHNNSWGAATASTYTVDSNDLDAYAAKRRDVLIVIAAGNEGTATHPFNSAPCFVDWLSIGSPAPPRMRTAWLTPIAWAIIAERPERHGAGSHRREDYREH
jgi:Subtilase family